MSTIAEWKPIHDRALALGVTMTQLEPDEYKWVFQEKDNPNTARVIQGLDHALEFVRGLEFMFYVFQIRINQNVLLGPYIEVGVRGPSPWRSSPFTRRWFENRDKGLMKKEFENEYLGRFDPIDPDKVVDNDVCIEIPDEADAISHEQYKEITSFRIKDKRGQDRIGVIIQGKDESIDPKKKT